MSPPIPKLEKLASDMSLIKKRLPAYEGFPDIQVAMIKKQVELEELFLDELQMVRFHGYTEQYSMYHHWYKEYKGIEHL